MLNLSLSGAAIGRLAGASLMMSLVVASLPLASSQAASKPIVKHHVIAKHHKATAKKTGSKSGMHFGSYVQESKSHGHYTFHASGYTCYSTRLEPGSCGVSPVNGGNGSSNSGNKSGDTHTGCNPDMSRGCVIDLGGPISFPTSIAKITSVAAATIAASNEPNVPNPQATAKAAASTARETAIAGFAGYETMVAGQQGNDSVSAANTAIAASNNSNGSSTSPLGLCDMRLSRCPATSSPAATPYTNCNATVTGCYPASTPTPYTNCNATVTGCYPASTPTRTPNNAQLIPSCVVTANGPECNGIPVVRATVVSNCIVAADGPECNGRPIVQATATSNCIVNRYGPECNGIPVAQATATPVLNCIVTMNGPMCNGISVAQSTATPYIPTSIAATAIAYPTVAYACYYGGYRCDATAQANPTFMPGHWCNGRYITGACDPAAGTPLPSQVIPLPAPPPGPAPTNQPVSAPAPVSCAPGYSLDVNICLINPSSNPYGPPSAGAGPVVAAPIISQPAATAVPAAAAPVATVAAVNPYCRYCLVASSVSASELLVQVPSHRGKHGARITVFALHIQPGFKVSLILAKKIIATSTVSNRGSVLLTGRLSSKVKPGTYMLIVKASDGYSYDAGTYKVLL